MSRFSQPRERYDASDERAFRSEVERALPPAPPTPSAHIADPTGGVTEDAEARAAIDDILFVLERFGMVRKS